MLDDVVAFSLSSFINILSGISGENITNRQSFFHFHDISERSEAILPEKYFPLS